MNETFLSAFVEELCKIAAQDPQAFQGLKKKMQPHVAKWFEGKMATSKIPSSWASRSGASGFSGPLTKRTVRPITGK